MKEHTITHKQALSIAETCSAKDGENNSCMQTRPIEELCRAVSARNDHGQGGGRDSGGDANRSSGARSGGAIEVHCLLEPWSRFMSEILEVHFSNLVHCWFRQWCMPQGGTSCFSVLSHSLTCSKLKHNHKQTPSLRCTEKDTMCNGSPSLHCWSTACC